MASPFPLQLKYLYYLLLTFFTITWPFILDLSEAVQRYSDISKKMYAVKVLLVILQAAAQQALFFFLRIWSHLLKKSLMENFILCAVSSCLITEGEVYCENNT